MKSLKAFAVPFFAIALIALVGFVVASALPAVAQGGVPPVTNIELRDGPNSGEVVVSWDAVPQAIHYRIGYVNMEVDYFLATNSCTKEWIEAFIYVDVNARNIPVNNGRAEYTIRRLSPGAAHAFTVLTSNEFVDTGGGGSVRSEFFWPPKGSRWERLPGRDTLPPGMTLPTPDCSTAPQPPPSGSAAGDRAALVALYNATGGPNWSSNDNWLSNRPIGEWYGVTTDASGRVTAIDLGDNALTGPIPSQLGNLSNLTRLNLAVNQLTGPIPSQLGNLSNLTRSNLTMNRLTGAIPPQLGSLSNLTELYLGDNQFSGPIPSQLGNLTNLESLYLYGNQLTGPIPSQLGNLSNLSHLILRNNQLSGPIPLELGNLTNLELIWLAGNQLTGCIPMGLQEIANNDFASLGLPFCGNSGSAAGDRAALVALYNATDGPNWTNNDNWLSNRPIGEWHGVTTDGSGRVTEVTLIDNNLQGTLPAQLGNLSNLTLLALHSNQLSGPIPAQLGNLSNLKVLVLARNQLSGPIPSQLGNLSNLTHLILHINQLSGPIPAQLGNLSNLEWVRLSGNQLTGCVPLGLQGVADNDFDDLGLPFCG